MKGIRRHGAGWQAEVRVVGHPRAVRQFPLKIDPGEMAQWRKDEKRRLQALTPPATAGTFAKDAKDYLDATKANRERRRHIGLWVAEFGTRPRSSVKPWEILAVVNRWLTEGPKRKWRAWSEDGDPSRGGRLVDVPEPLSASQVNNRLRALENLWTKMDGRHSYNPVREVPEPEEPEGLARGLPYAVVEAILAQMPDTRYSAKLSPATADRIRAALHSATATDVARRFGVSETMIRKVARGAYLGRNTHSLTKLRLRVIAYTGLSHGELRGIRTTDLHLDDPMPWVWVAGRRKGKGTKGTAQPLTAEGAAALRALEQADALGAFNNDSMRRSFQRACAKIGLAGANPYDLRHSFASEVLEKTGGNLPVTQMLMRHKSASTTLRYARAAIDPVRSAAIEQIRQAGGFAAPTNAPQTANHSSDETSK